MQTIRKKCLIISDGPVPTPEHQKVEGGGLRCWGLAQGIHSNNKNIDITVAYNSSYKLDGVFTDTFNGVKITTWSIDTVGEIIKDYDTIIVSYCMGDLSLIIASLIETNQQLILDCYVPIYVEVSARQSPDIEGEYNAFEVDVSKWQRVLRRGDIFLCASEQQKEFYKGVLAGIGRVNPITYGKDMIFVVPYGIYRETPVAKTKPITNLLKADKNTLKILWFGGIYPWFDIRELADAVKDINKITPAKLIVVGAKNPFNKHPDFISRYDEFIKYVSTEEMKQYVITQDWINFNDRADWYLDADLVVVINKEGEENKLAWRTRLVDFMWADLPVLTNGGDPLGEIMINADAAVRMKSAEREDIANSIIKVIDSNKSKISDLKHNLEILKKNYYWDISTEKISNEISLQTRAKDILKMGVMTSKEAEDKKGKTHRAKALVMKAKKVPAYAKKHGYKTTALIVKEILKRKLESATTLTARKYPAYVFISHQLDMSGGSFIAMDMASEFKEAGKKVEFYTYLPAHTKNISKLKKIGINPRLLMNKDSVPKFLNNDTVILNTVAHSEPVKESIFSAAENGIIKKIIWYLHEDDPEMLFRADEHKRIKKMLENDQLQILIAAEKMLKNYTDYFGTKKNIVQQLYKHIVPKKYHRQLSPNDFSKKLKFVLPGTVGDGRKGQLPIFYAFAEFYKNYYLVNKNDYRDFELTLIGISDDFISRQILRHASILDNHFSWHGKVTWEEDLDIVSSGNMTVCYSIRECLPLFVFEGMVSGHPVLRNDSSGMEEQLIDDKNGFYLESNDFNQVVATIERVLNKKKISDKQLSDMSKVSYEIAIKQETNSYLECLKEV